MTQNTLNLQIANTQHMEIESCIQKKKEQCTIILEFINSINDSNNKINEIIENTKKFETKDDIQLLFQLISKIADNLFRVPDFFNKLEQIIQYIFTSHNQQISNNLADYKNCNKRILYFLFERKYLTPNKAYVDYLIKNERDNLYYLYPVINQFYDENTKRKIEAEILEENGSLESFVEKCKIGENDTKICPLIRQDSIDDFIIYINKTNTPLTSQVTDSRFETNIFLKNRQPTLIEYSAYHGSIKIFNYLMTCNVKLTPSLWFYAIHSHNGEIIQLLEDNKVGFNYYDAVVSESIKNYFNDFSNYLDLNYNQKKPGVEKFIDCIIDSHNFFWLTEFFNIDIKELIEKPFESGKLSFSQFFIPFSELTIPHSVEKIGKGAFYNCKLLKKVVISSSVTEIDENSFRDCSSLEEISIPSSVEIIKESAFKGCLSLKKISIPSSVKKIEGSVFYQCKSLEKVEFSGSLDSIDRCIFYECSSLQQFLIPSSVKYINDYAFYSCSSLKRISIPSNVESIGDCAFSRCTSLSERIIPSSVKNISKNAFYRCP